MTINKHDGTDFLGNNCYCKRKSWCSIRRFRLRYAFFWLLTSLGIVLGPWRCSWPQTISSCTSRARWVHEKEKKSPFLIAFADKQWFSTDFQWQRNVFVKRRVVNLTLSPLGPSTADKRIVTAKRKKVINLMLLSTMRKEKYWDSWRQTDAVSVNWRRSCFSLQDIQWWYMTIYKICNIRSPLLKESPFFPPITPSLPKERQTNKKVSFFFLPRPFNPIPVRVATRFDFSGSSFVSWSWAEVSWSRGTLSRSEMRVQQSLDSTTSCISGETNW